MRRVVMDKVGLTSAVAGCSDIGKALRLPAGPIDHIAFLPEERCVELGTGLDVRKIAAEELLALLVADCRRLGIPLPRKGSCTLRILPDAIELSIEITTSSEKRLEKHLERYPRAVVWQASRRI